MPSVEGVRTLSDLSTNPVRNLSETRLLTPVGDPVPATERGTGPVLSEICPKSRTDSTPLIGDLSERQRINARRRQHRRENVEAYRKRDRIRYQRNREARLDYSRHRHGNGAVQAQRHGLTLAELRFMWNNQDGRCAICQTEMTKPQIDHDHATGEVRGLLCFKCNVGIGHLNDDPDLLRVAIAYIETDRRALRLLGSRKGAA